MLFELLTFAIGGKMAWDENRPASTPKPKDREKINADRLARKREKAAARASR